VNNVENRNISCIHQETSRGLSAVQHQS